MKKNEITYLMGLWGHWKPLKKLEEDLTQLGFELYDDRYYQKYSENHEFTYCVMIVESKQYLYGVMFTMILKTDLHDISTEVTIPGYEIENVTQKPGYLKEIYMRLFNRFSECIDNDFSITLNEK